MRNTLERRIPVTLLTGFGSSHVMMDFHCFRRNLFAGQIHG